MDRRGRVASANDSERRAGRFAVGVALASVTAAMLTAGCSLQDASCGGGEYPVMTVGSTGSACVPNDEDPPKGYVRYPEGKVPQHVGDKWDTYWETHTVDESGRITEVPADSGQ
ncbi:SCO0607 family lipoprotein [Streptomyces sp. NPDC088249]|uniref:SCO0607 family lipoprotein n=1 Tax=Streptomyces sp. NPDC088249 TaxID=3365843 RepID=UPI00380B01E7